VTDIIKKTIKPKIDELSDICASNGLPFFFMFAKDNKELQGFEVELKAGSAQKDMVPVLFELTMLCSKLTMDQQHDLKEMLANQIAQNNPANGETVQ
jgi:hypothetical protein